MSAHGTISEETINRIATNIVSGKYKEKIKKYGCYPILLQTDGTNPYNFNNLLSAIWLSKHSDGEKLIATKLTPHPFDPYLQPIVSILQIENEKATNDKNLIAKTILGEELMSTHNVNSLQVIPLSKFFIAALWDKAEQLVTTKDIFDSIDKFSTEVNKLRYLNMPD